MVFLKITGLVIVFFASVAAGLVSSKGIKTQTDNLKSVTASLKELAQYIRSDYGELSVLVPKCFDKGLVYWEHGRAICNGGVFSKENSQLLEEFFSQLGKKDRNSEYERTCFYARIFENRTQQSEAKCRELCRLYNALGILCGLFLCIFFL